jgi:hypothetical protein
MESKKLSVLKATAGTEKRSNNEGTQYLKSLAGWRFPARDEQHAWNCFDRRRDFDAVGCTPHLASQPELGLLPERWTGLGLASSDHIAVIGPALGGRRRNGGLEFQVGLLLLT